MGERALVSSRCAVSKRKSFEQTNIDKPLSHIPAIPTLPVLPHPPPPLRAGSSLFSRPRPPRPRLITHLFSLCYVLSVYIRQDIGVFEVVLLACWFPLLLSSSLFLLSSPLFSSLLSPLVHVIDHSLLLFPSYPFSPRPLSPPSLPACLPRASRPSTPPSSTHPFAQGGNACHNPDFLGFSKRPCFERCMGVSCLFICLFT